MSFLETINANGYEVLTALVVSNVSAQVIKTVIFAVQNRFLDLRTLVTTGGMPSSHSSSVVAMATTVGLLEGFESINFSLACSLAIVVMYDSAGVRRAAGKQAAILNRMIAELLSEEHKIKAGRLKELLGHSPKEVLMGAFLGVLVSIGLRYWIVTHVS